MVSLPGRTAPEAMLALIQLLRSWAWDSPADDADTDETGELADERTAEAAWDRAWPDTSLAVPQSEEVRRLVRRGVPSSLRSAMWRRCADECNYPGLVAPTPGHYHAMLQRAAEGGLALAVAKQIDKDLHRTFGSVPGVRVPQAEALSSLRNVLMACAPAPLPRRSFALLTPLNPLHPLPSPPAPHPLHSDPLPTPSIPAHPSEQRSRHAAPQTRHTTPRSGTASR